jgi:hypothetical protein
MGDATDDIALQESKAKQVKQQVKQQVQQQVQKQVQQQVKQQVHLLAARSLRPHTSEA